MSSSIWSLNTPPVNPIPNPPVPNIEIYADLASTAVGKGDALIGVKLDAVGSTARTQHDKNADWVHLADFGIVGSGDETTKLQAALNSGRALDFGSLVIMHSGVVATIPNGRNIKWRGSNARLNYIGVDTGVRITTNAGVDATGVDISGITFSGGSRQLYVRGHEASRAIIRNVRVSGCQIIGTIGTTIFNASLHIDYCDHVEICENNFLNSVDNAIYVSFSRYVNVHHNICRNCAGSGSITVGYADEGMTPKRYCDGVIIDSNIVINDDNAIAAAITSYLSGICVVFANRYQVTNNIVMNIQTFAPDFFRTIKTGILMEEYQLNDGRVQGNLILNMREFGMRIGSTRGVDRSEIRRLAITGNTFFGTGLTSLKAASILEGLVIDGNVFDTCDQDGIWIDGTCTGDTMISNNHFRHVGIQPTFSSSAAVKVEGINTSVIGNTFDLGHVGIRVTSTATTPLIRVAPSTSLITLSDGAGLATLNYSTLTFGQVAAWIRTRPNWSATLYTQAAAAYVPATIYPVGSVVTYLGLQYRCTASDNITITPLPTDPLFWVPLSDDAKLPANKYLRRTGQRRAAAELFYPVAPGNVGVVIGSYEPQLAIYLAWPTNGNCKVSGNKLNTLALGLPIIASEDPVNQQGFYLGQPYLWEKLDTLADVLESGGGTTYFGSASASQNTPATLPAATYYLRGDIFIPVNPAVIPNRYVCTTSGFGSAAIWKPLSAVAVGIVTPIASGSRATTAVSVSGVLVAAENQVQVTIDINSQGMRIYGYVSANNTVTVAYENTTGSSITLAAHNLRVYVT